MKNNHTSMRVGISNQIEVLKQIFDFVALVDNNTKNIVEVGEYKYKTSDIKCYSKCHIKEDKCGCICDEAICKGKDTFRLCIDSGKAYIVISRPVKIGSRIFNIVMEKEVDSEFSFGQISDDIEKVSNISSSLVRDTLTSIYNRKFLEDNVEAWIQKSISNNREMCIASIDIDNFKRFNDTYGHDFGDAVLITLAQCMRKITDKYEDMYSIRVGGDEFIIISNCGMYRKQFIALMNVLCKSVSDKKLTYEKEDVHISISIGTASVIGSKVKNYTELYKEADNSLYKAKEHGKNCVV